MAAADGQRFQDQSDQTQQDFRAAYGDNAEAAWNQEHNAVIGQSGGGGGGNASASSSGSNGGATDWTKDFFSNQAGQAQAALDQSAKQFKQTLGVRKDELKAQIDQWQRQTKLQYDQLKEQKGVDAANKWYQEQEINVALLAHQLQLSQLGLDYIKTGVEYASTPNNYWKLLDFQAGASQRQDVPLALQALSGSINQPAFQQAGGQPTPNNPNDMFSLLGFTPPTATAGSPPTSTVTATGVSAPPAASTIGAAGMQAVTQGAPSSNTIAPMSAPQAAAMGVVQNVPPSSTAGWNPQDVSALNTIMGLYANPNQVAPGAWDSTDPVTKALTLSGIQRGGGDPRLFLDQLTKLRPNQGQSQAA